MTKGDTVLLNGDRWTVVDLAPAAPLAEMVAAILEEEGFVVTVRGVDSVNDVFSHLGSTSAGATCVLVPEADAERALGVIADTVTDYEGDELDSLLADMGAEHAPAEAGDGEDEAGT